MPLSTGGKEKKKNKKVIRNLNRTYIKQDINEVWTETRRSYHLVHFESLISLDVGPLPRRRLGYIIHI